MKGCCFTGHREISADKISKLRKRLKKGVNYLYIHGITTFYTGGALGFDTLAAKAVLSCRRRHSDVKLIVAVPCRDQTKYWKWLDVWRYKRILRAADEVVYLSNHYHPGCMQKRNRYLVDNSCVCVCFLTKENGGTASTVQYARKRGLKIYNLA